MPRDPEVDELLRTTRRLTGQAFNLSRSINETITELDEFVNDIRAHPDRRFYPEQPHEGERRARD